ncbi:uroporphyrinogen-III C-methyltransferase [Vibrio sp. FNV 38]|nr:uroporphyrinogen-III C-methyltransferase [Vibrio sp. FNV 38]
MNNDTQTQLGSVTLVGAGPGDPDLLTVKALKSIQSADCIVFDNLVSKEIRQIFPMKSQQIYVGKAKHHHSATQPEINQILLDCALQGLTVCRVKGGDSFIFGRGGEEMLFLAQQGVPVDVIPGITAASGCTSYANIPLTHRGLAQGCTFITAHADKDLALNWSALATLNQTLVIYMGLSKTQWLTDKLVEGGMCPSTPAALIEKGCTPDQKIITGTLEELTIMRDKHNIQSPALIIIGQVVSISQQMNWLEQLNQHSEQTAQPIKLSA